MSKGKKPAPGAMLDLWRPPPDAGDALGCLATTYTFSPALFDEQCLARFLEIESEPNREDLPFLLERESRLGEVYAGVLVDQTQAGVSHSLRWDVLPVRVPRGKQHAKLSLLAWSGHVRIIVASANLTEPGYRFNSEVAAQVDLRPEGGAKGVLADAIAFLRRITGLVPSAGRSPPEVTRALAFLTQVERQVQGWTDRPHARKVRQWLACSFPKGGDGTPARSSLDEALQACRRRGNSPSEIWVASPFFDKDRGAQRATKALCKAMGRGMERQLWLCVPAAPGVEGESDSARVLAPRTLLETPDDHGAAVRVEVLPQHDADSNARQWHAKMLALRRPRTYSALMVGSSNFTCAGMGVGGAHNVEANLITVVDYVKHARATGELDSVWPRMDELEDPAAAEWLGPKPEDDEESQGDALSPPSGFLSATYRAGPERRILLTLDPGSLPDDWSLLATGADEQQLLSASAWQSAGSESQIEIRWEPTEPPDLLLVRWDEHEAFMPLNVEDSDELPAPEELSEMSFEDMLRILAASDPSAAFRAWARRRKPPDSFDEELDSATPIDLDPLRDHDIEATFLHRVRRRARVFAQLRANLERPVWSARALQWRLRGIIGIESLADRLVGELVHADGAADEALLSLADFLIVLGEVKYKPSDGALSKGAFDRAFRPFLSGLAGRLDEETQARREGLSSDVRVFWSEVMARCGA